MVREEECRMGDWKVSDYNPGHPASPAPVSGMFAGLALLVPPKAVVPAAARNYCAHPPTRPK